MSQPNPPQPPPTPWPPVPMTPPPNPPQIPPQIPPVPNYCCELAQYGDECFCADDFAEVLMAFESPLSLVHDGGTWRWEK